MSRTQRRSGVSKKTQRRNVSLMTRKRKRKTMKISNSKKARKSKKSKKRRKSKKLRKHKGGRLAEEPVDEFGEALNAALNKALNEGPHATESVGGAMGTGILTWVKKRELGNCLKEGNCPEDKLNQLITELKDFFYTKFDTHPQNDNMEEDNYIQDKFCSFLTDFSLKLSKKLTDTKYNSIINRITKIRDQHCNV